MTTVVQVTKLKARMLTLVDERGKTVPQYIIAAACGIHPTTFSHYCSGVTPFSAKHLEAICEFLQCQVEDIVGYIRYEFPEDETPTD